MRKNWTSRATRRSPPQRQHCRDVMVTEMAQMFVGTTLWVVNPYRHACWLHYTDCALLSEAADRNAARLPPQTHSPPVPSLRNLRDQRLFGHNLEVNNSHPTFQYDQARAFACILCTVQKAFGGTPSHVVVGSLQRLLARG